MTVDISGIRGILSGLVVYAVDIAKAGRVAVVAAVVNNGVRVVHSNRLRNHTGHCQVDTGLSHVVLGFCHLQILWACHFSM